MLVIVPFVSVPPLRLAKVFVRLLPPRFSVPPEILSVPFPIVPLPERRSVPAATVVLPE